jgi:hypothetical protein
VASCAPENSFNSSAQDSKGDDKPASQDSKASTASEYDGAWEGQCKTVTNSDGGITSMQQSFSEKAGIGTTDQNFYVDQACSVMWLVYNFTYKQEYGAPFSPIPGAIKTTTTTTKIEASFPTPKSVELANSNRWFGYSDWAVGVAKNISGRKFIQDSPDADTLRVGDKLYSIEKVVGQRRYGGDYDTGDGKTEATRPTSLDMKNYSTRQ